MDDKEVFKIIALNVRVERTIKSLTQAQLAELIDVHEKYIGTIKTLNKIANALKIDITKLLENKNPNL